MTKFRNDFPFFQQTNQEASLVYFDSAATTHKPLTVINTIADFYACNYSSVHRGIYRRAEQTTERYEGVRSQVARFIGAQTADEIVFTAGTTASINAVAATWALEQIGQDDEIVLSALEHHANILPWQQLVNRKKAVLKIMPALADGSLDLPAAIDCITAHTKLVSVVYTSNLLGTHMPLEPLIKKAHAVGARVLVDAAQAVAHQPVNVQALGCDFLVFSAHKMFGPTGVGVLYVRQELHNQMPPYQVGGGMVYEVDYHHASWLPMPRRFEAGTPPIAQVIGLGGAIDYMAKVDFTWLKNHEATLCSMVIDTLATMPRVQLLGPLPELKEKGHLVSFVVDGIHAHDVAAYLDTYGIEVRAGHHCVQPLAKKLNLDAAVRVSFALYTSEYEVERFLKAMKALVW
jgi:cysteine desulfurase/selenocysteine lyase